MFFWLLAIIILLGKDLNEPQNKRNELLDQNLPIATHMFSCDLLNPVKGSCIL